MTKCSVTNIFRLFTSSLPRSEHGLCGSDGAPPPTAILQSGVQYQLEVRLCNFEYSDLVQAIYWILTSTLYTQLLIGRNRNKI